MSIIKIDGVTIEADTLDGAQLAAILLKSILEAQGDLLTRNATVPKRLAAGTEGHVLTMGASEPGWAAAPTTRTVATGSYTGNDGDDRQVTVGFKCSLVIVDNSDQGRVIMIPSVTGKTSVDTYLTGGSGLHATDGFTVYQTGDGMNKSALTHYYWAISE